MSHGNSDSELLKLKNAVTALYFGRCLASEIKSKFGITPKKSKVFVDKLPSGLVENSFDFNRKVSDLIGIGSNGMHQQYCEEELQNALFDFASQKSLKADISRDYGIPERTLFDKRSELMLKLGMANKIVLKQFAITQPDQLRKFLSQHTWMGKTNTPYLDQTELCLVTSLESELTDIGVGKDTKGMAAKFREVVHAKGRQYVQVFSENNHSYVVLTRDLHINIGCTTGR